MDLRPLTPADHPALLALWDSAGLPVKREGRDSAQAFASQLERPGSCFLGAFDGPRLVGAVLANHTGRKGWINRLAVAPSSRREGIARRLVKAAEAALRADGIEITAALVHDSNTASLELFRALGYLLHHDVAYLSRRDRPEA